MQKLKTDNRGFSLVELIIVIAILAILSSVVAIGIIRYIDQARESKQMQDVDTLYDTVNSEIVSFFLEETNQTQGGTLFYGCEGNNTYTDSVTGETCGLITNVALKNADAGVYENDNSNTGRLLKRISSSINGAISFASDSPVSRNITDTADVYIMIIYNHSGIVRIEYAERGHYTVIDEDGSETKSVKDDNSLKFSSVY